MLLRRIGRLRTRRCNSLRAAFSTPPRNDTASIISALHEATKVLGIGFQVPRYVMVGDQSSGKTSLIEAIIGADISQKDATMATRRPLLLTLMRTQPSTPIVAEFADGERMVDFAEVKERIVAENAVYGAEVSPDPISLTIHAPHVYDCILIDLPGFIVAPTLDQPDSLPEEITALNMPYMQDPNSILCVVNTAVADPATSLALRQSRRADPDGNRSTGIVTKIDLSGNNKDALVSLLRNEVYPLAMGRFGVRCRTHQEQLDGVSFSEIEQRERTWIEQSGIAGPDIRVGVPLLRQQLSENLISRVVQDLPKIIAQLDLKIAESRKNEGFLLRLANEPDLRTVSSELESLVNQLHPASDSRSEFERGLQQRLEALVQASFTAATKAAKPRRLFAESAAFATPSAVVADQDSRPHRELARRQLRDLGYDPDPDSYTPLRQYAELTLYGGEGHMDEMTDATIGAVASRGCAVGLFGEYFEHCLPENPRRARAAWVAGMQATVEELLREGEGEISLVPAAFDVFMQELDAFADRAAGSKDGGGESATLARLYFGFLMEKIATRIRREGLAQARVC